MEKVVTSNHNSQLIFSTQLLQFVNAGQIVRKRFFYKKMANGFRAPKSHFNVKITGITDKSRVKPRESFVIYDLYCPYFFIGYRFFINIVSINIFKTKPA